MKTNKILPLAEPEITAFSHQAILTSILMAYEQCKPWICNNYIQIFTLKDLKKQKNRTGTLDFFYEGYSDYNRVEYKINPWIRYSEIPLVFIDSSKELCRIVEEILDSGSYVMLDIDEFYIPEYMTKRHIEHMMLIYGYDIVSDVFYCMDNFAQGKLAKKQIKIEHIMNAVNERLRVYTSSYDFGVDNPGPLLTVIGVAPKIYEREYPALETIDLKKIAYLMASYMDESFFYMTHTINNTYVYGIEAYKELINYFEDCFTYSNKIDNRALCSMIDHKKLMIWRLKYIKEKMEYLLPNVKFQKLIDGFIDIEQRLNRILFLLLKYSVKGGGNITKIREKIETVYELEHELFKEMLCQFGEYSGKENLGY